MGKSKKLLCICRNHKECSGVSAVFQVLNDKRSTFVELPPTRLERRLSANLDLAQSLRAAYLRHLDLSEESIERLAEDQQYYVASHHFDPSFVKDATVCKKTAVVCRTIQREIALSAGSTEQDQFKDGTYFVVPSYPFEKAKLDATNAFKAFRLEQQSKLQEEEQEQKVEPNVQAPTPPPTTVSTNKTTSTTSTSKDDDDHIFYDSASEGDYNMSDPSIGFASPHSANRNVEIFQDDASAVSSSHQSNKSVESYLNQSLRSSSGPVDLDEEVLSVDDGDSLTTGRREEDSKLAVVTPEHAPRRYEEEKKSCEEHDQTASLVVATKDENGPFLLSSSPAKVVTPCGEEQQQQQSPVMRLKGGGQWTDDDNDEEGSDKNHSEVSFDHESSEADIAQVDEAQEKAAKTRQELASNDSKELATTKKDTVPNKGSKDQTSPVVKAAHESEVEGVRGFNPFDDEEPDKVGMQAYKPSPKATDEDEHKELDDSFLTPPLDRSNEFVSLFESEMQRRKWTEKEIAAMSKEWRYYKSMIKRMTMETEWVQGLLERSHNSAVTYSDMLKAIHNDSFLDESDKVVLDPKRRHKLAEKREKAEQQRLQTTAGPSLLEPLLWAILGAAEKVDENLSALEEELIDMTNLADEVQQRSAILADAGAMAMGDMERMEATMQKAWSTFDLIDSNQEELYDMQSPPLEDRWLAEVTYKNCVKHGMSFVKDRLHSLKQAIDDVVSLDSQRLTRTKQILLSFLPRRRRLFLRVHESFQSTADKLNDERQGMEEVESQLDKVLEQLSRRNLSKRNRSSIMNRSRTWNMGAGDSGSPQNRSEATPTLPECNMLESSHILERKAVEVKMGAKGEWQLALALLTDDKYLHVLVYDSELPTDLEESQAETVLALKLKGKLPNLSVSRLDCNASLVPNKDHIELLVEGSSPLQKMLKRKVFLRLSSPSETSSWFDAHLHSWSSSTTDTESSTSSLFV